MTHPVRIHQAIPPQVVDRGNCSPRKPRMPTANNSRRLASYRKMDGVVLLEYTPLSEGQRPFKSLPSADWPRLPHGQIVQPHVGTQGKPKE